MREDRTGGLIGAAARENNLKTFTHGANLLIMD